MIPSKNLGNYGMVHCAEINQAHPLLNVAVYWKSSKTDACAKKLSQILANNIDNGEGEGIGLRIYVMYFLRN